MNSIFDEGGMEIESWDDVQRGIEEFFKMPLGSTNMMNSGYNRPIESIKGLSIDFSLHGQRFDIAIKQADRTRPIAKIEIGQVGKMFTLPDGDSSWLRISALIFSGKVPIILDINQKGFINIT